MMKKSMHSHNKKRPFSLMERAFFLLVSSISVILLLPQHLDDPNHLPLLRRSYAGQCDRH